MNLKHSIKRFAWKHGCIDLLNNQSGITLTELMISLAIGGAVLAAAFNTFSIAQAHADKQYRALTHQQDLRLGLEVFEQETRLARVDSIITTSPGELQFNANLGAHQTLTTGAIVVGQSVLPVQDGSGWAEGKAVTVCDSRTCESHRLARAGQRYQLTLAEPIGTTFAAGTAVEVHNRVSYYGKRDGDGPLKLMRMVDGGASVLIADLEELQFTYWDDMGKRTNRGSQVKRIVLELKSHRSLHSMVREVSVRS